MPHAATRFPLPPFVLHRATQLRTAVAAAALALGGCGGGGEAAAPQAPAEEVPPTLPITDMPDSSYSGFKHEAFERLNAARIAAGVSALKQNAQLDAAAQAHAGYLAGNYVLGHYETPGKPLFTGVTAETRAVAQGYANRVRTEIITQFFADATGADHIDYHLRSVYHLAGALDPSSNDIGIGMADTYTPGRYIPSAFTLGTTDPRLRPVNATWVWPVNGAIGAARRFHPASEVPNPLPDVAADTSVAVGAPIMFCGARANFAPLDVQALALLDTDTGQPEPGWVLHHSAVTVPRLASLQARIDPNLVDRGNAHCLFIVPKTALSPGRTYRVRIDARQGGFDVGQHWSFTTAD